MTFKVIFLFTSLILLVNARSNRVERQSPLSVGLRMIEGIRGGVQKTFQNFMGRFRNRNNQNEFPSRNPRPPPPSFQHPNFIQQQHAPDPVFKTATRSSFAVFHDSPTPVPFHKQHSNPEFFHFNDVSHSSQGLEHQESNGNFVRHQSNHIHHDNFGHHPQHSNHINHDNFGHHPQHSNHIVRIDKSKSFRSSQPIKRLPTTKDGWVALIPSENDIRFLKPKKQEQEQEHKFVTFQTHNNFPQTSAKTQISEDINNVPLISGKERQLVKSKASPRKTKIQKAKQHVKRLTQPRTSSKKSSSRARAQEPIYKEDIKEPLHAKPTRQRDIPTTTEFDYVTNAGNLLLQSHQVDQISPKHNIDEIKTAKLIDNGLKMELSPDKEKQMQVNGYEFGYGIVDKNSGNRFYHAEKKNGDQTKGSYKVQLPDGRIQTVDYLADNKGYHPKISFEGEAKFPERKQVKKYARPSS